MPQSTTTDSYCIAPYHQVNSLDDLDDLFKHIAASITGPTGVLPSEFVCELCGFRTHDEDILKVHPCELLRSETATEE